MVPTALNPDPVAGISANAQWVEETAGRIFERAGDLIRPAQDCSQRYGYALVFNRIDVLTDDEYRETPVGRVEPDWFPGLVATHTYNFGSDVEVIDGKRLVPRGPFDTGRAARSRGGEGGRSEGQSGQIRASGRR